MNYILLDTNIIIDMVVDRRNQINNKLLSKFIKLLDYGEVRLVVPEIIRTETYRHLDEEICNVGKQIENALDAIKNLYGISTLEIDGLDLSEYKKNARKELHDALTIFTSKREDYRTDIFNSISKIFSHSNTIVMDDISLMDIVMKRKIYKRAPFHKVEKESNGDGVIIETLLNIEKFIDIREDDKIYFVTGNYKDFSDSNDKNSFHGDIIEDIEKKGLDKNIIYIRTFEQLVGKELRDNVINTELLEEMEQEIREQEEAQAEQYEIDIVDTIRESFGLSSLGSFQAEVEELMSTSEFACALQELSGELSSIRNSIEELACFYDDEIYDELSETDLKSLYKMINEVSELGIEIAGDTFECVLVFQEWIRSKKSEFEWKQIGGDFETLEYGGRYRVYSAKQEEYVLYIDDLNLSPCAGEKDEIEISLYREFDDESWRALIEVLYGDVEEDEDGGIGNAYEEGVGLEDYGIVAKIEELLKEWQEYIEQEEELKEDILSIIEKYK